MSQSSFSNSPLSISGQENLLTPSEVAALFRVDPKTVTRWAKAGKLTSIRTLGGHRRYKESEVKAFTQRKKKQRKVNMSQSSFSNSSLSISGQENLLTPSEVAALFRVDPKTVTRWAKAGKLTSIRTLGGHRRYKESEVKALLKVILPNTSSNQIGGI